MLEISLGLKRRAIDYSSGAKCCLEVNQTMPSCHYHSVQFFVILHRFMYSFQDVLLVDLCQNLAKSGQECDRTPSVTTG